MASLRLLQSRPLVQWGCRWLLCPYDPQIHTSTAFCSNYHLTLPYKHVILQEGVKKRVQLCLNAYISWPSSYQQVIIAGRGSKSSDPRKLWKLMGAVVCIIDRYDPPPPLLKTGWRSPSFGIWTRSQLLDYSSCNYLTSLNDMSENTVIPDYVPKQTSVPRQRPDRPSA